jgi:DNA-binding MarR family transcriptional regulator
MLAIEQYKNFKPRLDLQTIRTYNSCLSSHCKSSFMVKAYYKAEHYEARKSVGYLLRRGRNLLTAKVEALFDEKFPDTDTSYTQWIILICLRDDLARTAAEISQYVCYNSGALTRVIDQLETRGLVKRKRSTKDRRMLELHLTPAGHKTVQSHIEVVAELYNDMLADFTREEADTMIALLTKFVAKLSEPQKGRN